MIASDIPIGAVGGLAATPQGHRLYAAGERVFVVDTSSDAVIATIPSDRGRGVAVTPDSQQVYVTLPLSRAIVVIATNTNSVVTTIPVEGEPSGVVVSPDGRLAYVTNAGSASVSVIDAATHSVVAAIPVGLRPWPLAITPDGQRVYVGNQGGNVPTISVIDTATQNVIATIPNAINLGAASPTGVAAALDSRHVYVISSWIAVIDTTTNKVVKTIPTEESLSAVALAADGRHIYVTRPSAGSVLVIDTASNAVVNRIRLGTSPHEIAVTATKLYVGNSSTKTVSAVRFDRITPALVDRSAQYGTPAAAGAPTACMLPAMGVHNIGYRDTSGLLHELWRDANGHTGTTNLTANANAPKATGNPFAYVDLSRNTEILLFRGADNVVRSLYWSLGPVGHDDLSDTAHAPHAAGDPIGYYDAAGDVHHVVYRSSDGHLHELHWFGVAPVQYGGNLTGAINAPVAAGDPSAMFNAAGFNIVTYRAVNGHILSVYWKDGPSGLDNLSGHAGTPAAASDPYAYYTPHNDMHQVVYRAANGHIWELFWPGVIPVAGWDLTDNAVAPPAVGTPVAYYSAFQDTKHVVYRSADGHLRDIWWRPGSGWKPQDVDLTEFAQAPKAVDDPAAFGVDLDGSHHVTFRAADNHIHEIRWP